MLSDLKGWEIIILVVLLVALFGAKRLPDAARGLGRSLRVFKAETKGLREDDQPTTTTTTSTPAGTTTVQVTPAIENPPTVEPPSVITEHGRTSDR